MPGGWWKASTAQLFTQPCHPYSQGLLRSTPRLDRVDRSRPLATIDGYPPNLQQLLPGLCLCRTLRAGGGGLPAIATPVGV
ncbi:MAG: hypothetical protein R3E89_16425 [Thiolinea sp.]